MRFYFSFPLFVFAFYLCHISLWACLLSIFLVFLRFYFFVISFLGSCLFVLSLSFPPPILKCRNPSTAFYQAFPCSRLLGSKPLGNRYELGLPGCVYVFTHESACTEQLSLTSLLSFHAWRLHGIVGDHLPRRSWKLCFYIIISSCEWRYNAVLLKWGSPPLKSSSFFTLLQLTGFAPWSARSSISRYLYTYINNWPSTKHWIR